VVGRGLEDGEVGGGDDLGGLDLVGEGALAGFELDLVAYADVAEGAEKSVAVGGEGDVAGFTGQGGIGEVAYGAIEGGGGISLNYDGLQIQARD
jgi:hypothetical protein